MNGRCAGLHQLYRVNVCDSPVHRDYHIKREEGHSYRCTTVAERHHCRYLHNDQQYYTLTSLKEKTIPMSKDFKGLVICTQFAGGNTEPLYIYAVHASDYTSTSNKRVQFKCGMPHSIK